MSNVHSINQDDMLALDGDDDLSPNAFQGDIDDESPSPPRKKSGIVPLIGGILAAITIVGFFGWKILSPYFANQQGRGAHAAPTSEAFAPASVAPQEMNPSIAPVAPATGALAQSEVPAAVTPQVTLQAGQSEPVSVQAVAAPAAIKEATAIADDKAIAGQPKMAYTPAAPLQPAQALPAGAEEVAQINKRIDGISMALAMLKETVEKLQAEMKSHAQAKPPVVATAAKPAVPPAVAKKSAPAPAAKAPADSPRPDIAEAKPAADLQLQAVLQDRAWFKAKTGETITVSAGEEVKGIGIVKQIDADGGRVIFANGVVYR